MEKNVSILFRLLSVGILIFATSLSYAQNCSQNNLNIQRIEFRDSNGQPFDPNSTEHKEGDMVVGQIFVTFGGSSTNAFNLRFLYDVYFNGVMSGPRREQCLFIGTNVPKNTPTFITNFTLRWGDTVEFRNIFMRWFTNSGNSTCPTEEGSNAQCYSDPGGETVNTPFIPLPVIWHNISAIPTPDQQGADIKWSTLKEWESSHFEIERSLNNADRFQVIDSVPASTYSFEIRNYQFIDNNIPPNTSRVYYRLKQVDLDRSFEYSKVLMVNVNTKQEETSTWQLYPNPILGNDLKISLKNPRAYDGEQIRVKMISNLGVYFKSLPDCLNPYEIDIGDMIKNIPRGIIIVELSWGNSVEIFKVIKY